MSNILLDAAAAANQVATGASGGQQQATGFAGFLQGWGGILIYLVVIVGFFYFVMIRPQSKEKKKMAAMMSTLEAGDSVLTSSGFYGTVIDVTDDSVIVEFGNNKNCRIPMQKAAIVQVEKPDTAQ
ncbi:MAG: preprotein translocase subunit YajC [Lachnospiraceae bacterium]|nr:preprotein translocase subunit YajC [Candidatus Merdinaster equi]